MKDFPYYVLLCGSILGIAAAMCFGIVKFANWVVEKENAPVHSDFVRNCDLKGCQNDCLDYVSFTSAKDCLELCAIEINLFCEK